MEAMTDRVNNAVTKEHEETQAESTGDIKEEEEGDDDERPIDPDEVLRSLNAYTRPMVQTMEKA